MPSEATPFCQRLDELPVLRDLLPHIETPVQIITGDHDPGVLPVNGEYLHERLPHNKHDYLNAGHFLSRDQPNAA